MLLCSSKLFLYSYKASLGIFLLSAPSNLQSTPPTISARNICYTSPSLSGEKSRDVNRIPHYMCGFYAPNIGVTPINERKRAMALRNYSNRCGEVHWAPIAFDILYACFTVYWTKFSPTDGRVIEIRTRRKSTNDYMQRKY